MLPAGHRLGPYEIVDAIGEGGMGQVYRARDTRLGRDVAIKVLPPGVMTDPERLRRFELEARAVAALSHPNILAIHDVEVAAGATPYLVMELLDGAPLRDEIGRGIPPRKTIEWGVQIANGLAAAHEKGIVHRDLKPENLFLTRDGRIKILDFGLARISQGRGDAGEAAVSTAIAIGTEPGAVLGTVGYMSPEQVRGQTIDHRSDIFSFGCVLHEMLSGRRPFIAASPVETMNAILTVDPAPMDAPGNDVPPALDRIVRRCLEKRPADRFYSAHDLALALEATSDTRTPASGQTAIAPPPTAPDRSRLWMGVAAVATIVALALAASRWLLAPPSTTVPTFTRLTFRRGSVDRARFIPGTTDAAFSAKWQGAPSELYSVHPQRLEAQSLGQVGASLLAVSSTHEIALMLAPRFASGYPMGTLATAPMGGGGAREIATRIRSADYSADGADLAYVEYTGETSHIYFPAGHLILDSHGSNVAVRLAPKADLLAFVAEGPFADKPGLSIIDRTGAVRMHVARSAITGLAWTRDGSEVWFSETLAGDQSSISAVGLGGSPRLIWRGPGDVTLEDISSTGAALVDIVDTESGVLVQQAGRPIATDLGWLGQSIAVDVSPDGNALLIDEGFGSSASFYIRKIDGSPAVRLGNGMATSWSHDGRTILAWTERSKFLLTPLGPGAARDLPHDGLYSIFGWFLPDNRVLFNARAADGRWRFYVTDLAGHSQPVGPDALDHWVEQHVPSDDGTLVAGFPSGQNMVGQPVVFPIEGGPAIPVRGFDPTEAIMRFTTDGQHVLVYDRDVLPVRLYSLDYRTGQRTLWREFTPADPTGIAGIRSIAMSPGGTVVAYNYARSLSTLYLIEGLR